MAVGEDVVYFTDVGFLGPASMVVGANHGESDRSRAKPSCLDLKPHELAINISDQVIPLIVAYWLKNSNSKT